jgi:SAM-dependent methyltransferase
MTSPQASAWSDDGYVTETPYTRSYLRYQTPIAMSFAAQANGFDAPDFRNSFHYCDLGCGEAVTVLALATAYPHGTFVGVDLNPVHTAHAQAFAERLNLKNITFFTGTFDAFAAQNTVEFDYVAAHGVYSWVAPEVRTSLVQAAHDCLGTGGLFYFCHYVLPGGAPTEALFHMFKALFPDDAKSLNHGAAQALKTLRALEQANVAIFDEQHDLRESLTELENRDARYLVHEFCNQHFCPRFFKDVADDLAQQDFTFVGTSNDAFRWDVFKKAVKPSQTVSDIGHYFLDSEAFPFAYPKSVTLWNRQVSFDTDVFRAIINPAHSGTFTINDVIQHSEMVEFGSEMVLQTVFDMLASRKFQPLVRSALPSVSKSKTSFRFTNGFPTVFFERDFLNEGFVCFPSEITGSAIVLSGFQALAAVQIIGRDIPTALSTTRSIIESLSPKVRKNIGVPVGYADELFERDEKRFKNQTLPKLIKYEIIS